MALAIATHSSKLLLIKMKVNILLGICEPVKRLEYAKKQTAMHAI